MILPSHLSFRTVAIVGITLLSLALGGSTELWAQAVIVLLGAILIMLFPPRQVLDTAPTLLLLLFLALALCAFLPTQFGFTPEWRRHLSVDLHADLGPLRTPQSWLTLQSCGLLFFGLIWTYYLFSLDWSPAEKSQALRLLVSGIILLAAVSITCYVTGYRIPGWNQASNRGWFPNRNQTADVLALGGVVNYVVAFKSLQKRHRSESFWLVGLALIGTALVITYSRAGIIMFFCGVAIWHILSLFHERKGKSIKYTALGFAALLFLLSLFLLFGGSTLARFLKVSQTSGAVPEDNRVAIQEDALVVSLQTPYFGVGLGNFEPVFTALRQYSADQNRTLHPESDWLWMAVEMGWLALAVVVLGVFWWVNECLPFAFKSGEALRRAAMVAALLFLAHGFVDVSGHRLGSFLVGIFMIGAALSPAKARGRIHPSSDYVFRGLGLLLGLMGTWWLASLFLDMVPPTTATLARIQTHLNVSAEDGRLASVYEDATKALELAPLEWTYYFHRASAEAFRTGGEEKAARDFQIARYLEPHWTELSMNEGDIWLAAGEPGHCLDAWQETLRRAGQNAAGFYVGMLKQSQNNPDIHRGLQNLAATNAEYLIAFLDYATPEEAKTVLDSLLTRNPSLASLNFDQQQRLFASWYAHGNRDDLAELLQSHQEWREAGWPYLAHHYADIQDYALASVTALRYMTPPNIKQVSSDKALAVLQTQFEDHPEDVVDGVILCQAEARSDHVDEALDTIASLENLKDCPRYIFYLKAQLCVKKQEWDQAWDALLKFGLVNPASP